MVDTYRIVFDRYNCAFSVVSVFVWLNTLDVVWV